jgi:3-amino-4-hydroxybenzoic acid synthase
MSRMCWVDLRGVDDSGAAADGLTDALLTEAIHHRVDAVVVRRAADLDHLPPTVTGVLFADGGIMPEELGRARIVVVDPTIAGDPDELARAHPGVEFCAFVSIVDAASLEDACFSARTRALSLLRFADPTKIPLEIVLAAATGAPGRVVTQAVDPEEARVLFGVLERGSDGVMLAPAQVGDVAHFAAAARPGTGMLDLVKLTVTRIQRVGMGERVCVDTCSQLGRDEGLLVGCRATGMVLCASETHPLPYMPTRPFRVNAGALMSYTLGSADRTRYLCELTAGATALAVDAAGRTRPVTVGRVKIETRPLLAVEAQAPDSTLVTVIVQDDWHVRLLGPGGAVLNSTALVPGDEVLGFLGDPGRHVGYQVDEFCREQ